MQSAPGGGVTVPAIDTVSRCERLREPACRGTRSPPWSTVVSGGGPLSLAAARGQPASRRPCYTLTYVYRDSTAVLGPLAAYVEPHCYDLCAAHADRLTVPARLGRGPAARRPCRGAEAEAADDLEALANAVREATAPRTPGRAGRPGRRGRPARAPAGAALRAAGRPARPLAARPPGRAPGWPRRPPGRLGLRTSRPRRAAADVRKRRAEVAEYAKIFKAYDIRGDRPRRAGRERRRGRRRRVRRG